MRAACQQGIATISEAYVRQLARTRRCTRYIHHTPPATTGRYCSSTIGAWSLRYIITTRKLAKPMRSLHDVCSRRHLIHSSSCSDLASRAKSCAARSHVDHDTLPSISCSTTAARRMGIICSLVLRCQDYKNNINDKDKNDNNNKNYPPSMITTASMSTSATRAAFSPKTSLYSHTPRRLLCPGGTRRGSRTKKKRILRRHAVGFTVTTHLPHRSSKL